MKTIVFVHNTSRYLELHYTQLITCFLEGGWRVCCVAPRDEAVKPLEELGVCCFHVNLSRRGLNPFREAAAIRALFGVFRRSDAAAVFNFSIKPAIYGSIAARLAGVPHIFSMITGLGYVFLGTGAIRGLLSTAAGLGYRVALAGNQKVFFQNPNDRDFFLQRRAVKAGQAVVLNGTGIDTERFSPRARPGRTGGVRFLMVARLLVDKGVREYVQAAAQLRSDDPRIHCALLGPRDDNPSVISEAELEAWIREGALEYLGESDDVAGVIAGFDVFVLPSYREGLPRATLEAMAMGKPVVTTDVPGCRETVKDGVNGYLVPPRDADALADAMARFVENPALVASMGRASREMAVRRYDVHAVNREIMRRIEGGGDDD